MSSDPAESKSDGPSWAIVRGKEFETRLKKLTKKDSALRTVFEKKIRAVVKSPLTTGRRSVSPPNTRHVHVKSHWVLWWRVEGNKIIFLECGHHDEFFRK